MSYIAERLSLISSALEFLDRQLQFRTIKEQAPHFEDAKAYLVYNFNITIDIGLLIERNAALGSAILSGPIEGASLFQEIIFQFCQSHDLLPLDTTPTQICARLRIVNFPTGCDSLRINGIPSLTKCMEYPGFVLLTGVVVGLSGVAKYTQSTKYVCPEEMCEGHHGNRFIRMHIPGASETQTIRNDFRCTFCGDILVEITSSRTLSDKVVLEMIPISVSGPAQREIFKSGHVQPIPVFVRDELIDIVTLGDACHVIGITRKDTVGETIQVTLEANNISKLQADIPGSLSVLPESVKTIFDATRQSPWSLPLNMAYRFGDQIVPGGTMIKLRLALLISLVLNPQKRLLHILGLGAETGLTLALFRYAERFSHRSFPAMMGSPLCGKVSSDSVHTWAPYFIHAGVLPLSSGGVCQCGDLGQWKKQNREQLQAILSGSKIFLDLAPKFTGSLAQQLTFNLSCHVWGAYSPLTSGVKAAGHRDEVMGGTNTGNLSKSFLDAFSYVCFLDGGSSSVDEETYTQVCYHNLVSWCGDGTAKPDVEHEDMDMYISIARQLEPTMTPAAESLIQSYHAAVRLARSSGLSGSDVPASGAASLTSLASGFAKLRLSSCVQETDAVMAAFLYEESLVSRLGLSVLSVQPQPHITDSCISDFLGKQNDIEMQKFQVQLLKFCSRAFESRSGFKEE